MIDGTIGVKGNCSKNKSNETDYSATDLLTLDCLVEKHQGLSV